MRSLTRVSRTALLLICPSDLDLLMRDSDSAWVLERVLLGGPAAASEEPEGFLLAPPQVLERSLALSRVEPGSFATEDIPRLAEEQDRKSTRLNSSH